MTKFAGLVTYAAQQETKPGVWTNVVTKRPMRGDMLRAGSTVQNDDKVNSNISLNHRISLIGDAYSFGNYFNIKAVSVDGYNWEVTSIELQRPRIIVTLGGLWNEG